ncbi:coiled-coil domain-containing protein [Singulisphaera acidiphila]|uniref:hypothetical protein n=1 Tax=Singulisphaera acidiphila TaxID=466153 RepID=UPI0002E01212|nr:hypothetical protein [Singulisphaera acidiphila]
MPASATPELIAAIHATNQAQGFTGSDTERTDELAVSSPMEFGESGGPPLFDLSEMGDASGSAASRGIEHAHALAEAEARHARQLERAQALWGSERQGLEEEVERLVARHSQQLEALRDERDAAHRRAEDLVREQMESAQRITEVVAERDGLLVEREAMAAACDRLTAWHSQQLEVLQGECDVAHRRVEDLVREQVESARRVTEVEAERDGLLAEQQATAAAGDRLVARVDELERSLGEAQARHADELTARREEERRALALASDRLARERDNSSEQLRDVLGQLEDALAQLDITRRQGEAEREAMRKEIEVARSSARSIDAGLELLNRQELDRYQGEVERLAGEVNRALDARDAESRRCGELAERLKERDDEIVQIRLAHEAEAQAQQLALEELQLMLKSRQRPSASVDPPTVEESVTLGPGEDALPVEADPGDPPAPEKPDVAEPLLSVETPTVVVPRPNPSNSPDERIAALRTYLRNVQDAERERLNKGLFRRLARAWRH